jgi:SpoVK/Ycf46/Vps4 family AAA+-type ATPase
MPCFVFIDEIDETLRRSSPTENNAVRGNVFKRMMEFMSDPELRGKVVFIGACNHPSRLDEALKRTGRFDIKIPFMPLYNDLEREEVFKIHLSKYGYNVDIFSNDFRLVLNKTKGYTHADVEGIVVKAISLAKRRGLEVDSKLLLEASGYIKRMESEELEQMTKEALDNCNDLEFVPKYILDELYKK